MKTFIIQATVAYAIDVEQGPIIIGEPRDKDAKAFAIDRLDPMLRDTPQLVGKVVAKKSREAGNTQEFKKFVGGSITITGAQSPENFAIRASRWLFLDEVDRYPPSAGKEGNPIELARQRQTTYDNRKELICSTPTIQGQSMIEREYAESDQREWFLPCPDCRHMQTLRWGSDGQPGGVRWGEHGEVMIAPSEAHYECAECRAWIPHFKKAWMNARGEWRPQNPAGKFPGFRANQLISPRKSWGEIAEQFLRAKDSREDLIVFVNTVLAECWQEKGDAPDWEKLQSRAEDYPLGIVPAGAAMLTAGVDVQKDWVEGWVRAWGARRQSWVVDHIYILGRFTDLATRTQLDVALDRSYPHAFGAEMQIAQTAIDSGYYTTDVYQWVRTKAAAWVMAVKGITSGATLLGQPSAAEITVGGRKLKAGIKLWPVNVNIAKAELYGWLRSDRPEEGAEYPSGWVHFSRELNDEFYKQLTAEQFVTRIVKGYKRGEWVKTRDRNEALDSFGSYARAAAERLGISRMTDRHWERLVAQLEAAGKALTEDQTQRGASQAQQPAQLAQPQHRKLQIRMH
jgi:phage terminase large subunit GpA-like protein